MSGMNEPLVRASGVADMTIEESLRVEIIGVADDACRRLGLPERVHDVVAPLGEAARRCRVAFADDNGPKGGVAIRCRIDVQIAHWPGLHVEGLGTSPRVALHEALDRLKRRIVRLLTEKRVRSRHPKKYFVAARALAAGGAR